MKNKTMINLIASCIISFIIIIILLGLHYLTNGNNDILKVLVQGEVIAGIAIALPTFATWLNSINEARINESRLISENAMEIVKYYDNQLAEITNRISENKEITLKDSLRMKYLIETFNKLFEKWGAAKEVNISLNYNHIIPVICNIPPSEKIAQPGTDKEDDKWKNNLAIILKQLLKEIIKIEENEKNEKSEEKFEILKDPSVKYFALIKFGIDEINFNGMDFHDKVFVECTFTKKILENKNNSFVNCQFINCSLKDPLDDQLYARIKELKMKNNNFISLKDKEGKEIELEEIDQKNKEKNKFQIIDNREKIVVDNYITSFKEIIIDESDDRKIKDSLIKQLFDADKKEQNNYKNKKISISRNYVENQDSININWGGWHSLFFEKLNNNKELDYFIFVIREANKYFTICFKREQFEDFLKQKIIDKSGKYNFYFSNIMYE